RRHRPLALLCKVFCANERSIESAIVLSCARRDRGHRLRTPSMIEPRILTRAYALNDTPRDGSKRLAASSNPSQPYESSTAYSVSLPALRATCRATAST